MALSKGLKQLELCFLRQGRHSVELLVEYTGKWDGKYCDLIVLAHLRLQEPVVLVWQPRPACLCADAAVHRSMTIGRRSFSCRPAFRILIRWKAAGRC